MQVYLVGGAVRDQLLNIETSDRDYVVVGATPAQLIDQGYQQVGKDFPVFLHPASGEEYALARTERKQGQGYTGFECDFEPSVSLEQDLCRRDLTVNAIAKDSAGQLIDPHHGQQDLNNKILRHVSDAFEEDPLRVLRVARFHARFHHLGFKIAPETLALMRNMSQSGELDALTPERVWKETEKALQSQSPHIYFRSLRQCHALKVLFPELEALFGVPASRKWHPEVDSGDHTLMVLQQAQRMGLPTTARFAALCHDYGKALTKPQNWPSHHGHGPKGMKLVMRCCRRLKVPNSYQQLALMVAEYHITIHSALELKPITILKIFSACDAWRKPERFELMLACCKADALGRGVNDEIHEHQDDYPQAAYLLEQFKRAQAVDVQMVIQDGFKGAEIKIELEARRTVILTEHRANQS
ncbi:multifunctional CCA addition/repair protein [Alginatibacterium sediminis]|uniref:Multifunctional CCA protein n=1 Tax=Alginatibacterium sediminis TaxID=2164068 RepID=A0A420ECI9_9ALTE|nr:multifunctional CCA addition/repair protein [Alginatibacterium sediminis]RKF18439.1 multifunctional CCA addition/repair protein [Alginatibacterium sediminis]